MSSNKVHRIVNQLRDRSRLDFVGVDLAGADLRKADLRAVNLRGANLREADLGRANLCGSDLSRANLRDADLGFANLASASLCEADLRKCVIIQANLTSADLTRANLQGAYLQEADLSETTLEGVELRGANLRGVRGNSEEVKSMQVGLFSVVYTARWLWIGCAKKSIKDWAKLTAAEVSYIASSARGTNLSKEQIEKAYPQLQLVLELIRAFPADPIVRRKEKAS